MTIKQSVLAGMSFLAAGTIAVKAQDTEQNTEAAYYRNDIRPYACFDRNRLDFDLRITPDSINRAVIIIYRMASGDYKPVNMTAKTQEAIYQYAHREGSGVTPYEGYGVRYEVIGSQEIKKYGFQDPDRLQRFMDNLKEREKQNYQDAPLYSEVVNKPRRVKRSELDLGQR